MTEFSSVKPTAQVESFYFENTCCSRRCVWRSCVTVSILQRGVQGLDDVAHVRNLLLHRPQTIRCLDVWTQDRKQWLVLKKTSLLVFFKTIIPQIPSNSIQSYNLCLDNIKAAEVKLVILLSTTGNTWKHLITLANLAVTAHKYYFNYLRWSSNVLDANSN